VEQLRALRDFRWSLMALRAEAEDPGDAPVFDNPQDLLLHLRGVRLSPDPEGVAADFGHPHLRRHLKPSQELP
jgi:hypothetical protein